MNAILIATITRPPNTAVYASGSVIGNSTPSTSGPQDTNNFLRFGSGGAINEIGQVRVISENAKGALPEMELWVFDALREEDKQKDGEAFNVLGREIGRHLFCIIPLKNKFQGGKNGGSVLQSGPEEIGIRPSARLTCILVVRQSYAPISGEEFVVQITSG